MIIGAQEAVEIFLREHTSASKNGTEQVPIAGKARGICAFKWPGFYITEEELEDICRIVALKFAGERLPRA